MSLPDVQYRIALLESRARERGHDGRHKPPGVRVLPPLPPDPASHELARRQQCEATTLFKRHGRLVQCTGRGYDLVEGHVLCWVHRRVVLDNVASLSDVLAGRREKSL